MCSVTSGLCNSISYSLPGYSVHGIFQILEWTAISYSRGSFQLKDQTHISWVSSWAVRFFTTVLPGKPHEDSLVFHFSLFSSPNQLPYFHSSDFNVSGGDATFYEWIRILWMYLIVGLTGNSIFGFLVTIFSNLKHININLWLQKIQHGKGSSFHVCNIYFYKFKGHMFKQCLVIIMCLIKWLLLGWILFLHKVAFYLPSRKVLQGVTQKAEEEHSGSFQT